MILNYAIRLAPFMIVNHKHKESVNLPNILKPESINLFVSTHAPPSTELFHEKNGYIWNSGISNQSLSSFDIRIYYSVLLWEASDENTYFKRVKVNHLLSTSVWLW